MELRRHDELFGREFGHAREPSLALHVELEAAVGAFELRERSQRALGQAQFGAGARLVVDRAQRREHALNARLHLEKVAIFQANEADMLNFDIAKIKSIELYQKDLSIESQFDPFMKYSGVFSITTYLHEEIKNLVYPVNGLTKNNEEPVKTIPSTQPDLRSMLSWQSKLIPDAQGRLNIQFQSSDLKGPYTIQVEGINGSGEYVKARYLMMID